MLSSLTDKEM